MLRWLADWYKSRAFFAQRIDRARDKKRIKRGGDRRRLHLNQIEIALDTSDDELIALEEALEKLAQENKVAAELVKLHFLAGLSLREAALSLGLALRTAERQWPYARAWLYDQLRREETR
jgi:DNA-directed RNA polymerase specialized sigma24 family protein